MKLARNVVKYMLFRDLSIRSDRFGREHMADLAARFVKNNRVEGAYLEFGVFRGTTFAQFYHTFRKHQMDVAMYAFDSFEGLPKPAGHDARAGYEPFRAGQFGCSEDEFVRELADRWVPRSAYTIVKGFYEETLTADLYEQLPLARAALVWIDSVLYASVVPVLRFIEPILQDGTLLMFNDYFRFKGSPDLGERLAFTEFLQAHPELRVTEYAKFSSVGQAFIVHLRQAPGRA